jgi:hyperosmotically inducible protein
MRQLLCHGHANCIEVRMGSKRAFVMFPAICLLAACGRVGEDSRAAPPAALERAQVSEAKAPQQPAQPPTAPLPPPEALTDSAITGRIVAAVQADPAMEGADVSINTDKGVVVLSGTVRSHEQTGVASAHAQRQDGVLRVDNHLRPEPS